MNLHFKTQNGRATDDFSNTSRAEFVFLILPSHNVGNKSNIYYVEKVSFIFI